MAQSINNQTALNTKLKWLMLGRLIFAVFIIGGAIIYSANEHFPFFAPPLIYLYWLAAWIILLSLCYAIFFSYFEHEIIFAYIQTSVDTLIVSAIIFLTGCFSSLFTFLYLIVIIYASMLHSRRGTLIIASLCSVLYGVMVDLEYYKIIKPVFLSQGYLSDNYVWNQVLYKLGTVISACFATAFLSTYLSEQERRAQSELAAMETHVKRVERMAVVGEMASGLAHEIKNPLASLSGSIQLLNESRNYDQDQKKLMRIALREAERLSSLVSEFLQFARPKTGKLEAIRVDKVLEDVIALLENDNTFKGRINIIRNIDSDLWTEMDEGHLKQVVLNLLLNAAEAVEGGAGIVMVKSYPLKSGFIRIKIQDNGHGIDETILPSIFDPFFTTKAKGTGLGLSIVHRILEAYDYRVDVKSEKGCGTEFILKLKEMPPPES